MEDRYFKKALELLKSPNQPRETRIGVLNLILNLVFKDKDGSDSKVSK